MKMKLLILISLSLLFVACTKECEIAIYNDTPIRQTVKIDHMIYQLDADDPPAVETFYLNSYVFWNEIVKVPVEFVPNSPYSYAAPESFKVEMNPGKDRSYHVVYNRGVIKFRNVSPVRLYEIFMRQVGEEEWSENILSQMLDPVEEAKIALYAGAYEFRFFDDFQTEYNSALIEVIAGETEIFLFWGEL